MALSKQTVYSWLSYAFPDKYEEDPKFRTYLARLSRIGLLVAGILAVVGSMLHIGAHTLLLGKSIAWTYRSGEPSIVVVTDKLIILFFGVISIVLSRVRREPRWGRLVVFLLILAACVAIFWDDIAKGDISLSAGYLTLAMLIGVGAMPFRPLQVFLLGATIMLSFYLSLRYLPTLIGTEPVLLKSESFVLLTIATFLCPVITGFIYHSRRRLYQARQKQISLRRAVTDYADELKETNLKLRETQTQLVQSEKMAALGNLVAGVAHEVNTPLGAIHSNADTAQRVLRIISSVIENDADTPWSDEKEAKVNQAIKALADLNNSTTLAACRIDKIVKALRGFACLDEAEYQTFDLHKGIEDTITLLTVNPEMQVEIEKDFTPLPKISCRPGQINQVFMNLLINAMEAVEKQGKIIVRTRLEKEWAIIQFIDNGKGIPNQDLEHIFDPGFTTKGVGVGTGLGLSICYRILKDHGGSIDAYSAEGKGATFTIRLPLTRSNVTDEGKATA